MKVCTKCGQLKNLDEYFVKDKAKGYLHSQCKTCYREHRKSYSVAHYKKYGDAYRARAKTRRARIKRELRVKLIAYMSDKACAVCTESDIRVLEFDHMDSTKKSFSIARGITDGMNWSLILDEISKCQILCANCHKKRTAKQFGWFKAIGLE